MKKLFLGMLLCVTAFGAVAGDHTTDPDRYYLVPVQVLDSQYFLSTPPDTASMRYAYDREQYKWGKAHRDGARGRQAVVDADLSKGWLDRSFSEAFGAKLTPENAPNICRLIYGMQEDAGDLACRAAKNHYMRPRPFMVYNEPSATPDHEEGLRKNGSYPSGHTSIGWATALILAELNPDAQNAIMKRGYEFGQSRVICGAHFQSDVDAGRLVGAALVARLHADKKFRKDLEKARKEAARLRGSK